MEKRKICLGALAFVTCVYLADTGRALAAAKIKLRWNIPNGLKTQVTASGMLKMAVDNRLSAYDQPESSMPDQQSFSWKKKYYDIYKVVEQGSPRKIVRRTEVDSRTARNPQNNKMEAEDLPAKDSTVTMTVRPDGSVALNEDADPQVADEFKSVRVESLVSGREFEENGEVALTENQLTSAISLVTSGSGKLKLMKVEGDPELRQKVAEIEGDVKLVFNLPIQENVFLPIKFEGKIKIKYVPEIGLEILRKIDGKIFLDYQFTSGAVKVHTIGSGELHDLINTQIISGR